MELGNVNQICGNKYENGSLVYRSLSLLKDILYTLTQQSLTMLRLLPLLAILVAAPASAGEIGVRSTWGHSTTNITNGRSVTRGTEHSTRTEHQRGLLGSTDTVTRRDTTFRDSYDFNGTQTGGFTETSIFSR